MEKHVLSSTMANPVKRGFRFALLVRSYGWGEGMQFYIKQKNLCFEFLSDKKIKCSQYIKQFDLS